MHVCMTYLVGKKKSYIFWGDSTTAPICMFRLLPAPHTHTHTKTSILISKTIGKANRITTAVTGFIAQDLLLYGFSLSVADATLAPLQ